MRPCRCCRKLQASDASPASNERLSLALQKALELRFVQLESGHLIGARNTDEPRRLNRNDYLLIVCLAISLIATTAGCFSLRSTEIA